MLKEKEATISLQDKDATDLYKENKALKYGFEILGIEIQQLKKDFKAGKTWTPTFKTASKYQGQVVQQQHIYQQL